MKYISIDKMKRQCIKQNSLNKVSNNYYNENINTSANDTIKLSKNNKSSKTIAISALGILSLIGIYKARKKYIK